MSGQSPILTFLQRRSRSVICIGFVWACFALSSCSRDAGTSNEIRIWAMGKEGEVLSELVPAFEKENPQIKVRVQALPWSAAHEKLLTSFAGESLPDLCQLGNTWMPEFTTLHALEDLSPWIASSKVIQPSDYFTGIWDTNVFDRKAFGIPWYVDTRILFYRQDVFREAGVSEMPTTWKAWDEAMQKVKAHIGKDRFVILLPITEFEPLVILALQQKSEMLANNGTTSNFNNPDFKRAFSFYMDAFSKGYAPGVGQMQIANLYQEFEQGFFASYITGPWNVGEFKARLSPSMQGKWMTAPMPAPSEGQPNYSTAGGASLVMFRQSAHKSQAWKFMEYLSRPDVQTHFHALTGNLPPRQTAWQDSALALDPYMKAFRLQLQNTRATPKVPEWERIATEIRLMAEQVLNKKLSQDQGIAQLEQTVNRILEKRRWMMQR